MINNNSRARDKTVTALPVLIPTEAQGEGDVIFQEGRATRWQAINRFIPAVGPSPTGKQLERFRAISRMCSLASGKKIDYALLKENFRSLMEDAFGPSGADEFSAKGFKNPKPWSRRWLPAIFNREIKATRLVMYWPDGAAQPDPAIYCPDPGTALFVSLLFSGIRACLGCERMFTPERPNQLYHDRRCADRHRKRRERSK